MPTIEERLQALEQEIIARKQAEEMLTIAVRALVSKEAFEKLQETIKESQEQNGKLFNVLINQGTLHNERMTNLQGQIIDLDGNVKRLQAETRETREDVKRLQAETRETREDVKRLQAETHETREDVKRLQAETHETRKELRASVTELRTNTTELKEQNATILIKLDQLLSR